MKGPTFIWYSFAVIASFYACEDVVEVSVPSEDPRLVIDGLIRMDTTDFLVFAQIKVSETSDFFEDNVPTQLQQITMAGQVMLETPEGSGIYQKEYVPQSFTTGEEILLQIDYEDQIFIGNTNFNPSVPIDNLVQGTGTIFDEDDTEIIITYTDIPNRDDYYLIEFGPGNFVTSSDEFYQGQQFEFSYFYEEDTEPGEEIVVSIMGITEDFYNYMNLLLEQSEGGNFGVFETPAATTRGNVFNVTDIDNIENFNNVALSDNYPLGYFALVQEYKDTLTIQ